MDWQIVLITVVLTLGNLAICIHRSSRVYLYQQSICLQHYLSVDPTRVSAQWVVEESLCKTPKIQSPLSMFEGVDTMLMLLPGEFSLLDAEGLLYTRFIPYNRCS